MAKINFLTAYPTATPAADSIVIGSLDANGATNNFLMSDIAAYVMSPSVSTITLQQVCDIGAATTTGITVAGTTTLNGTVDINNTADIADTLVLSKAVGYGLEVTDKARISGQLICDTNLVVVTDVAIGGNIDANGTADIADTLTLSKPSGTALSVSAGSVYFASNLDVFGLHHQWGALTVEGITTLNNALDANSTADISDTLTLSRATGTGLSVTSNATIGGVLSVGSSSVGQTSVIADGFQTNNASFTATSSAVQVSFLASFNAFNTSIGGTFRLDASAPASSTSTGTAGQIAVDATHIYVCVGTDSWGRVAIDTTPF